MSQLPAPVQRLIDATNAGDSAGFLAAFAPDAVLVDWGKEFRGAEAIADWNESDNIGRESRLRVLGVERDDEAHLVRIAVSGKGFNGESFFRFTVADGLISNLSIAP
ncbi:nuclear transport factor 2 family protein [uncultured Schumannella sp.]|uniref:nuclear transport factor 2 family protein n=1 Tax=uncultured Schumannella sp. TaxID=1195956 RepID=UPI0025FDC90E|nr:nuclear transport factor 2 family protein [uncultured Schumannella sp.]